MNNRILLGKLSAVALSAFVVLAARADMDARRTEPLVPGKDDGPIAYAVAQRLEQDHYLHKKFDDALSTNFFDRYFEVLDPQHLHFLQTDIKAFAHLRDSLDDLTLDHKAKADTSPAFDIFQRFYERLEQRTDFAIGLLKTNQFKFDSDEKILLNRKEQPYPADLAEAQSLWRDRLRYEYLEERLSLLQEQEDAAAKATNAPAADVADDAAESADVEPPKSINEQIVDKLTRRYKRTLYFFTQWDSDDVIQLYLDTLAHMYDPHSDYMGRAQLEDFAIQMNLSLFGIGAQLRSDDGYCTIQKLLPGGPAIKSKKLKAKDRIVAVAQADEAPVDVVDMPLKKVVQLIRGPKGTEVRLTIVPGDGSLSGDRKVVSIIRDEIPLEDQAAKAAFIEIPGKDGASNKVGVIDLPTFYAPMELMGRNTRHKPHSTTEDVSRLIGKLEKEGIQGLILDLRQNGGGSLEEAVNLTGLFIKEGPVVQVRNPPPDGKVMVDSDTDPSVLYSGPMLVLTSRGSASASEIVAGALQDYGRAIVVGDSSTHGKGTVQKLDQLRPYLFHVISPFSPNPGALKTTIRKFYRANGESTQLRGVTPNIVLPSVANVMEDVGEAGLKNPLKWDTIESADFKPVNQFQAYLPELKELSEARVRDSRDFDYIREDMARFQKMQDEKTVSLNEAERLKEREDTEARNKARKAERKSRPSTGIVTYELTLQDVDKPGLPAPVGSTNSASLKTHLPELAQGGETLDAESSSSGKLITSDVKLSNMTISTNLDGASPVRAENSNEVVTAVERRSSSTEAAGSDGDEESDEPAVDPVLNEAEHILQDYILLTQKSEIVTAGKPKLAGPAED